MPRPNIDHRIRELYFADVTVKVIARRVGRTKGTIDKAITRLRLASRNDRAGNLDRTRQMLARGCTRKRIAAKLGVCPQYASKLIAEVRRNPMLPTCNQCGRPCRSPRRRGLCWVCHNTPAVRAAHKPDTNQRPDLAEGACGDDSPAADLDRLIAEQLPTMPVDSPPEWSRPKALCSGHELKRGYAQSPHGDKCPLIPLLLADVPITPAMADADKWLRTTAATMTGLTARTRDDGKTVEIRAGRKLVMKFSRQPVAFVAGTKVTPTTRQQKAAGRFIAESKARSSFPTKGRS